MRPLTEGDVRVLSVIAQFSFTHGYGPTWRDICGALGWASTNAASDYVKRLEARGLVARTPKIQRSLRITAAGHDELIRRADEAFERSQLG